MVKISITYLCIANLNFKSVKPLSLQSLHVLMLIYKDRSPHLNDSLLELITNNKLDEHMAT